ncbi:hypothetical protein BH11PAT4_BH11PAT4_7810 [soil metagenome]
MQNRLLVLQACLTGQPLAEAEQLVQNFYHAKYGVRNASITPSDVTVYMATFQVPTAHWRSWQETLGELQGVFLRPLPGVVTLADAGEAQTMAAAPHWGMRISSHELSDIIGLVRGMDIAHREVSGYQPFLSLMSGTVLGASGVGELQCELNRLLVGRELQLKPKLVLTAGQLQVGGLRTKLNPYAIPAKALLLLADTHPGKTPAYDQKVELTLVKS